MNKKKFSKVIIALSLTAVVGIGGTLAYLSSVTETKENTFTMGAGITGETDEPNWDEKEAEDFTPGKVIKKDPIIKNLSPVEAGNAYVAAKISYKKSVDGEWADSSYEELDKFINIQTNNVAGFNTNDWLMEDNNETAYYLKELAPQNATTPIFTDVEIDPLALTPEQVAKAEQGTFEFDKTKYEVKDAEENVTEYTYTTYTMYDFQIIVTGYMVQTEGFNSSKEAMAAAFTDVFVK